METFGVYCIYGAYEHKYFVKHGNFEVMKPLPATFFAFDEFRYFGIAKFYRIVI